jgi:phosphate/sulfate permease
MSKERGATTKRCYSMKIERRLLPLKKIALELCTCTWIETLSGAGIALYLFFGLHDPRLAVLTVCVFAPLIGFHFAISTLSARRENIIKIKPIEKEPKKPMNSTKRKEVEAREF